MAKQFKDFIFNKKRLTDIADCIPVDFDDGSDIPLAMRSDMESGETSRCRTEPNYYGDTWTDPLEFELDIMMWVSKVSGKTDS